MNGVEQERSAWPVKLVSGLLALTCPAISRRCSAGALALLLARRRRAVRGSAALRPHAEVVWAIRSLALDNLIARLLVEVEHQIHSFQQ